MSEDLQSTIAVLKVLVFPAIGFAAGFFTKWFLQSKKSRDELLRQLAVQRTKKLMDLWNLTTPYAIAAEDNAVLSKRVEADKKFREWYFDNSGAMFLSWSATKKYFEAIDTLRDKVSKPSELKQRFSLLRTALKRELGIYTWLDSWEDLTPPRAPL